MQFLPFRIVPEGKAQWEGPFPGALMPDGTVLVATGIDGRMECLPVSRVRADVIAYRHMVGARASEPIPNMKHKTVVARIKAIVRELNKLATSDPRSQGYAAAREAIRASAVIIAEQVDADLAKDLWEEVEKRR